MKFDTKKLEMSETAKMDAEALTVLIHYSQAVSLKRIADSLEQMGKPLRMIPDGLINPDGSLKSSLDTIQPGMLRPKFQDDGNGERN